jgi:hypothetical protein
VSQEYDREPANDAGSIAVVCGFVGFIFVAAIVGVLASHPAPAPADTRPTYSTAQFEAALSGKSKQEVMALLGKPDKVFSSVEEGGEGYMYGMYGANAVKIIDSSGAEHPSVTVYFDGNGNEDSVVY